MTEPASGGLRAAVVILAAGAGKRLGADANKVLLDLDGIPVLAHSARTALGVAGVHRLVVVVRPEERAEVADALGPHVGPRDVWLVEGGAERHDSEDAALRALRPDIEAGEVEVVAVHDAARPLASADLFTATLAQAARSGSAVPVLDQPGLNRLAGEQAEGDLVAVQTPQAFAATALLAAFDQARAEGFKGTDTAACLERYAGAAPTAVAGEGSNIKVTYPGDITLAAALLAATPPR